MKKCPNCSRTYPDDTLAFCLEDGALLSASYNPIETNTPTVAINAGEVPTVVANEIPTIVANEIPTVVNSPRVTGQINDSGIGWKTYLAGLFISLVVDLIYSYLLFPFYLDAVNDYVIATALKFENAMVGFIVANLIFTNSVHTVVYGLLAYVLGFIFPRGKWKWGIIALIPNLLITLYYTVFNLSDGYDSPIFYIRLIFINILYIIVACLFAYIGSWVRKVFTGRD